MNHSLPKTKVYYDNDGNIDDMITLLMLLHAPNIEVIGMSVIPADCDLQVGIEANLKLLQMSHKEEINLAFSNTKGRNPFNQQYKDYALQSISLPDFLNIKTDKAFLIEDIEAPDFMAKTILSSPEKVTVILTGPPNHLTQACKLHPSLKENIKEVIWMGGAVDVKGNNHNQTAECNCYWDPQASRELLMLNLDLYMFPLDASNQLPVTKTVLDTLAKQSEYFLSRLVSQLFTICYSLNDQGEPEIFMWDQLTAAYAIQRDLASFTRLELDISQAQSNEGQVIKCKGNGHWVNVATEINVPKYYNLFYGLLKH